MNDETFRSRLLQLLQKSRKAVRLYSTVTKQDANYPVQPENHNQLNQWREVNQELSVALKNLLDSTQGKALVSEVFHLRDRFLRQFRLTECDLHLQHKDLMLFSEKSDFAKVASIASNLIALKARVQALEAVCHELQLVVDKSNVSQSVISLTSEVQLQKQLKSNESVKAEGGAKIIPLRRLVGGLS